MLNRRDFITSLAGATASLMLSPAGTHAAETSQPRARRRDRLGQLLPQRTFGTTGEAVTMLGLGGYHIGRMDEREAQKTIETALAGGVRFFDTAETYQNGGSEQRFGKLLVPKYRDVSYIMTKTTAKDAATARRHLDGSRKRLNTDVIDLWQIHSLATPTDAKSRIDQGVLDVVLEAREKGQVRHIGFTGHRMPQSHTRMLELTDTLQTCQMPINASDPHYASFINHVLPMLTQRKMGVIAMKTLAGGGFFGKTNFSKKKVTVNLIPDRMSVLEAIHFVWSLPVSVLVSGPDDAAMFQEKINLAAGFVNMTEADRRQLLARAADRAGHEIEYYKA